MTHKLLILAPATGGKSTLMRYLRVHTQLRVVEIDEEIMRLCGGKWPPNVVYDQLVFEITAAVLQNEESVIYLAKDVPQNLVVAAKEKGFIIVLLDVSLAELQRRNRQRMEFDGYPDVAQWLPGQKRALRALQTAGLINVVLPGEQTIEEITAQIITLASR